MDELFCIDERGKIVYAQIDIVMEKIRQKRQLFLERVEDKSMVKIKCKKEKFLIKGTFDMGIAGVFENKRYGKGNIELDDFIGEVEDLLDTLEDLDEEYGGELKQAFLGVKRDGKSLAKAMEEYLNKKEEKVQKNIKQMNDYFLYRVIEEWVECETPFWECKEAILPEYADKYEEADYKQLYQNKELCAAVDALYNEYNEAPNDGSMVKTDVEALAKKLFPMFDFDGLKKSIHPDCLVFGEDGMSVQFSDGWGDYFYCSACEKFDENLAPGAWANF